MARNRSDPKSARVLRPRAQNKCDAKENSAQPKATKSKPESTALTNSVKPLPIHRSTNDLIFSIRGYRSPGISRCQAQKRLVNNLILDCLNMVSVSTPQMPSPRIMALEWHPDNPNVLIVGGKHGDLLYITDFVPSHLKPRFEADDKNYMITSTVSKGHGITTIKFDRNHNHRFYTTSIYGQVNCHNLVGFATRRIFQTDHWWMHRLDHWFTGLDIDNDKRLLLAGDNKGYLHLMPTELESGRFAAHKLHKSKIHTVELHPKDSNIFVTSSVDRSVKLWDIRYLDVHSTPLDSFIDPNRGLGSATFSKTNGGTVAIMDQSDQLIFAKTSDFNQRIVVKHSHGIFQHLTPIKPSWHPLADILVIGRYKPSIKSNEIDFFDGQSGQLIKTISPELQGVKSLNAFNCTGDSLASSVSSRILIHKHKSFIDDLRDKRLRMKGIKGGHLSDSDSDDHDDYRKKPKRPKSDLPKKIR